jgi:hypothetical protein
MNPRLLELLREQYARGFPDMAGMRASATIPLGDRLVTQVVAEQLPATGSVRELEVRAHADNHLSVRLRLTRPALLPPLTFHLLIEQQPELPLRPVFVLRMTSAGGLMSIAGSAARFLNLLPPGIEMAGDRIAVNVATLLAGRGAGEVLEYLEQLEVTTDDGRFILSVRGGIQPWGAR